MDDHIHAKFPTVQRSQTTVTRSGISGSETQPLRPPRPNVTVSRLIQARLLYEDGSEASRGSFTPGETGFLAPFPANHQNLAVDLEDFRLAHRPAPPVLMDRGPGKTHLPRKTVHSKKSKRKRRAKGKKLADQKRPRHNSPNREQWHNVPQRTRKVSMKSIAGAQSNNRGWHHPTPEQRYGVTREQNQARRVPWKSARFAAMSAPSTDRYRSPVDDILPFQSPSGSRRQRPSGTSAGPVTQRGRKTLFNRPSSPVMTPTPPPPEQPNNTLALGEIAHGIARLDPLLARYNIRSNPLFLSRNLRDGWVEKVRAWDREGTTVQARPRSPVPNQFATREERFKAFVADAVRRAPTAMGNSQKASLPRTFCLKLKRFDLRELARVGLPSSARIAATLYIHNPSSDPVSCYLGSFTIGISQSTANFFPAPYRIPPSGNSEANNNRTDAVAPWFIRVTEDEENVTLRALTLPGGIAYVDLLLYDFADESMDLQGGIGLPWSAAKATQVYARVEIAGPDGFSATSQLVPLVWLRHEFRDRPGVQTDLQPPAFLHVDLEWGSDSAAPLIRPRIFKPAPQLQPTPPRNSKILYRLSLQGGEHILEVKRSTWACVLCNICAPFPTRHVLKVHIRRAHPQVEARFNKKKQDPVTGEDIFDIKLILPPEAIELSDDEEEAPVTQAIAPSTRIGALLAASTEDTIQQVHVEASTSAEAIGTMPSTPPRVLNQIKEEEEEQNENWQTNNIDLLPISRARSHSPTPALDSPVRRRRDHDPSSPTSPTRPNRSTPAPEAFAGGYSSRTHNKSRIYDVLRQLPMNYGVLTGQIIANEEEMFAEDYVLEGHEGFTTVSEEARLMGALWSRWVAVEKNRFIANSSECIGRFVNSFYLDAIICCVGYRYFVRFMVEMASRGRIKSKEVAILCRKYKAREQELTEVRQAHQEQE